MELQNNQFPYYTSNGFMILFSIDDPGQYLANTCSSVLYIDIYDRAMMLQSCAVLPDYTAFMFLQTLEALQALDDNDSGAGAVKTIEVPPDNGVRKSIILSNAIDDMPTPFYAIPDEYLARLDGVANSHMINMGILETNQINGQHMVKTYQLNVNDQQFDNLISFLYGYFEMNIPRNNKYGYSPSYYYEHIDEFFD